MQRIGCQSQNIAERLERTVAGLQALSLHACGKSAAARYAVTPHKARSVKSDDGTLRGNA
jgi:hypothetical protein